MNTLPVKHTKTLKRNTLFITLVFLGVNLFLAQNKLLKLEKEFSFSQIPLFKLNASHTQLIFTPWDKNTIGINAYAIGDVDKEYLKNVNDLWEIQIQSSDSILILNTDASKQMPIKVITSTNTLPNNQLNVLLKSLLNPMLTNFQNTSMSSIIQSKLAQLQFDFEAYNREGEAYLKNWEENLVKNYGQPAAQGIHNWSKLVSTKLAKKVSENNRFNNTNVNRNTIIYQFYKGKVTTPEILVNKVIEIKIPKTTLSYLNTRYGSITLNNTITNLQAKLKYTPFKASHINGRFTNIKVMSAPVQIDSWDMGKLQLQYVKSGEIKEARQIDLNINSSRFLIHSLSGRGMFTTSFSQLGLDSVSSNFSELSFFSTNSDVVLSIPNKPFSFVYSGEMSQIKMPQGILNLKSLGDRKNLMLHGFFKAKNSQKEIQMNVTNSQVVLK